MNNHRTVEMSLDGTNLLFGLCVSEMEALSLSLSVCVSACVRGRLILELYQGSDKLPSESHQDTFVGM